MEGLTLDDLTARVTRNAAGGDSLDQLDAAIALAAQLDHNADAVVDAFVAQARRDGRSWTEIGARLGVSKQAARKRFAEPATPAPVLSPGVALRPRLQTCLTAAERHAQAAGAAVVETDHLLAGLLAEGVAAAILDKLSVTADRITSSSRRLFGEPAGSSSDTPPLSAEAICAIEAAAHHAQAAAENPATVVVGTEHLLLVLALDPGTRARRVLVDLGVDIATMKKELACYAPGNPARARRFGRRRPRSATCSFCGTPESHPRKLIHGPGVTICETCARRALQNLDR
jgi:ATP-dependent Clp protease ATP-binding subunit ClpA